MRFTAMQVLLLACFIFAQGDFAAADATEATEVVYASQVAHDASLGISPQTAVATKEKIAVADKVTDSISVVRDALLAAGHSPAATTSMIQGITSGAYVPQIKDDVFLGQGVGVPKSAICSSSGGTLPCDTQASATRKWDKSSGHSPNPTQHNRQNAGCKDSDVSKTFKYWLRSDRSDYGGMCRPLIHEEAFQQTITCTTFIPGTQYVLSKAFVAHPNWSDPKVGVFGFKRVVCKASTDGKTKTCEEFKTSFCIQCPSSTRFSFSGKFSTQTSRLKRKFMTDCAKHAFDSNGKVKSSFACNAASRQFSQYEVAAI